MVPQEKGKQGKAGDSKASAKPATAGMWVRYLLALIANYAKHNTDVALAFIADPTTFNGLTEAARCRVFNTAMSLFGVGLAMPKVQRGDKMANVWNADMLARGVEECRKREPVSFSWVHVRYSPLPEPSGNQRPNLSEAYKADQEAGLLGTDAPSFRDATTVLCDRQRDISEAEHSALRAKYGVTETALVGRPAKGGFVVAIKATLPEREKRAGSKGAIGGLALLQAEGVTLE